MTREQAIQVLEQHLTDFCGSLPTHAEAIRVAIKALRPALDDNGLARCGCGGQAFEAGQPDASDFVFECFVCGIRTKSSPNRAWAEQDWNRAMGVMQ